MNVNPGELNKKISIMALETVTNENGIEEETRVVQFTPWAKVSNMSGAEMFKNNSDYSKVTTRFLIRYRKDIEVTTDMKIVFKDKIYNITYVNNYNFSNEYLDIIGEVVE